MPNKTIYVSQKDEAFFDEAKQLAGEGLSSVISQALREYVSRYKDRQKGMKEIKIQVGAQTPQQEQRFIGQAIGKWQGFSDDGEWFQKAVIYLTQKGNWAVHLSTVCKASLLTNRKEWKASGDYLVPVQSAELFVAKTPEELTPLLPVSLDAKVHGLAKANHKPIEYLDI